MLCKSPLWIGFCVVLCFCVSAPADELKTADEVIAKYIEAIGGREKLDSIKSIRMTGKSMAGGGMEIPITLEFKRPAKMRVEFTFQGMTGVQAYDGETGWFILPFSGRTDPEKMSSDQVEAIEDQVDLDGPLVDYGKKGHQVELIGKDDVEGSETYKLKVTKKSGNIEYHYLDAEYFLPIQTKGKRKIQGTEIEFEVTYGDYKEVNGLLLAHSIDQGAMGGTMTFDKVELNIKLSDDRFTMPEVKKEEVVKEDKEAVTKEEKEKQPTSGKDKG